MLRRALPSSTRRRRLYVAALGVVCALAIATPSSALLPTSPRVKDLIQAGVATLKSTEPTNGNDLKLGGKCLVGLALHKAGEKDSSQIQAAVDACRAAASEVGRLDNYSHGLAIIFLTEVGPKKYRDLILSYLGALKAKQKPVGGWGYPTYETGDTSQTQYAALALWQAHRGGIRLEAEMVRDLAEWLVATQDPEGGWGYQGQTPQDGPRVKQTEITPTMVAAAGASLMITADLHGLLSVGAIQAAGDPAVDALPPEVRRVIETGPRAAAPLRSAGIDWNRVDESLREGEVWMDANDDRNPKHYACYYLYSLERYESFREARLGEIDLEPKWYEEGVEYLENRQREPGLWNAGCAPLCDTSFALLFLLRSTQKSLSGGIGEGAMVSGRGLPKNLAGAKMRRGQVVIEMDAVGVTDFLSMIDEGDAERLDALAADPTSLIVGDLTDADSQRLEQSLRYGEPDQRLIAARALGRSGDLDNVPALLFGLTDPDPRIALAARDGLRFIARRPKGFGMQDDYTDDQRYLALEQWKRWYLNLRPEAPLDLGR